MCTLTTAHRVKIIIINAVVIRLTKNGNGGIVLLPCINPIRELVVCIDAVKLRCWLVHNAGPGFTVVEGDGGATIVAIDHVLVVIRIDPVVMMITVWCGFLFKSHTAVNRFHERRIKYVHDVFVHRVSCDMHVVPGAGPKNS